MDYEWIKILKKAGYPLQTTEEVKLPHRVYKFPGDEKIYVFPTLDHLIYHCGEHFTALIRKGEKIWLADGGKTIGGIYGNEFLEQGETPEIAVIKLWLQI